MSFTVNTGTIQKKLQQVQGNRNALLGEVWTLLRDEGAALHQLPEPVLAAALGDWYRESPGATILLLRAARTHADKLAPAILRAMVMSTPDPTLSEALKELLLAAAPSLSPAMRLVAASPEPGVPDWPHEQNFPPLESTAGRQARLRYLGYLTADPFGTWGVESQAALIRFQLSREVPNLGIWDDLTQTILDEEAIGKMCMNRDDPATVFDM